MNITLIGMPGADKSHVGRLLAEKLGLQLLEIDKVLEAELGAPLPQVVARLGEQAFLDAEARAIVRETIARHGLLISPGGSVIYRADTMQHLRAMSVVIYLRVSTATLEHRIGTIPRGIIGMREGFEELYRMRTPLYERFAHHTVNGEGSTEEVADRVIATLHAE